jgi:predicted secreted Zn-dependent protease
MRKLLLALMIVGIPALLIYAMIEYLPSIILAQSENPEDSVLNKQFKDITVKNDKSKEVFGDKNLAKDYFYRDVKIEEVVNKNTEFYTVKAETPWELKEKILEYAPENSNTDRKSIVKVTYNVDLSLDVTQEDDECKFYGAKINTNITMILPHWDGVDMQDEEVQNQWHSYLDSVSRYESRHNKLLEKASSNLAYKIKFVPKQALCDDLIKKIQGLDADNKEKTKTLVRRYRSETGGGRMLGVQVPSFTPAELIENAK